LLLRKQAEITYIELEIKSLEQDETADRARSWRERQVAGVGDAA